MRKNLLLKLLPLLFLLATSMAWAQERSVSGKVTSQEDGTALPGVNVVVKGTTNGTVTDAEGNYKISVPSSGGSLVFSFIGLSTSEVEIGDRTTVDVSLSLDVQQLSEVVVTGYGTQDRKTLTSSITSVSAKDIAGVPMASPDQMLQGRAVGVQVSSASGTPGGGVSVRVRGSTSINASSDPLYVVDGIPIVSSNLLTCPHKS
jgi:hypothetical protein